MKIEEIEKTKYFVIATKEQLKSAGIEEDLLNEEVELLKDYYDGYCLIRKDYEYVLPKRWLRIESFKFC